jgi:YfiH family protein
LQARPVFLSQVHGARVEVLGAASRDGVQADACLAAEAGLACTIMVADCLPVLFSNRSGSVVAAAHAGWRGLAGTDGVGVLESTVAALRAAQAASGDRTESEWLVWLGPCIGPQAFEVGAEVRQAFVAQDGRAQNLFRPHAQGKWLADLPGLARLRLAQLGVNQVFGNDGSQAWCTFSQSSRFFSHRRDRVSGRLAACIWLV